MNTSYNVSELTRTDYIRLYISWQYVAISTISNAISNLDTALFSKPGSDKVIKHPHEQLITYDLLQTIVSSLQLTGTAYLLKEKIGNKVDSLKYMRTDLVTIEEKEDGSLKGYRYSSKNKNFLFMPEDVIDISLYSPFKTFPHTVKGISPMQAVAVQAEMDATANRWNWNIFKNGGSVADVLTTEQVLTDEVKERVANKWRNKFQGVNNAHRVAVLDSGLQYNHVKVNQKELDFVESRRFTRDEVLAIFKVPKAVIGITDDVNRATAQVAENIFYRMCISPLSTLIADAFNKHLFNGIGYFQFVNVIP
jgi:HK97 family phage portal protein